MKPLTGTEFWEIKHAIDDEVARLGWSKDKCIKYITFHYGCRSRLTMTDAQLTKLLAVLRALPSPDEKVKTSNLKDKRRRRKRL